MIACASSLPSVHWSCHFVLLPLWGAAVRDGRGGREGIERERVKVKDRMRREDGAKNGVNEERREWGTGECVCVNSRTDKKGTKRR